MPNPLSAHITVLIDGHNVSAALDFIDELKMMEHPATLVGETTKADRLYMELRTVPLVSGEGTLSFPIKVYRNRMRGDNEPYHPDIPWTNIDSIHRARHTDDQVKVILLHGNENSVIDDLQVVYKKVYQMNKLTIPLYVGIILQKDDAVFLIQRRNTNWASGCWNFPGGLVEKDESIKDAAIREIQEEVGVIVEPDDLHLTHVLHVKKNESNTQDIIGIYFTAHQWRGAASNNETGKISNAQWFNRNQLPSDITEHALLAISGLDKQQGYSEHGW